jgi:hypothetical protein
MGNVESIGCDYAGCKKEFAHRIKGFNLCAEHCFAKDELLEMVRDMQKRSPLPAPPEANHDI